MKWFLGLVPFALLTAFAEDPAITVYNDDFAVVRETVSIYLDEGLNQVAFTEITAQLEPDSLILREVKSGQLVPIREQSYRADPVSEGLLLSLYEGQTIDFLVRRQDREDIVPGKIVRSGYVPPVQSRNYRHQQVSHQPVIEIDGKLRFNLPGTPLFPALKDDVILKPTLNWVIPAKKKGEITAELAYLTGGMSWDAAYNITMPETGDELTMVGWVTIDNRSGKTFEEARIKLMAGDVNKIAEEDRIGGAMMTRAVAFDESAPQVKEKSFDEFHLYTLQNRTTLHDQETKQVEFVRASGIQSERLYIYDGSNLGRRNWMRWTNPNRDPNFGTTSNPKVWVYRVFGNEEDNQLGIPLPKGKIRFYRQDDDGQLEFTGENEIDHTPKDETIKVYTGNAFDIVGERKRTDFKVDASREWLDESFEIVLRNHKEEAATVHVVEYLYRWSNWEIRTPTDSFDKIDSRTIEFVVEIPPDGEKTVNYTAHYTW